MDIKKIVNEAEKIESKYKGLGFIGSVFGFFQGRATTFAIAFTVAGIVLAFAGKLTADYVALVGAIQALVFAHSAKEDMRDFWRSGGKKDGDDK